MSLTIENGAPWALVTGATGGLGIEFCKLLAARGYRLVITGRDASKLMQIRDELPSAEIALAGDLTDPVCLKNLVRHLQRNCITPEVVINNAGFGLYGNSIDREEGDSLNMIELNIKTLTALSLHYAKEMQSQGRGFILNVASIAAFMPCPELNVYGASKAYVLNFTEGLHEEMKSSGVHITALCPGPVLTGFWNRAGVENCDQFQFALTEAVDVARYGLNALFANRAVAVYGRLNKLLVLMAQVAPRFLVRVISHKILSSAKK